MDETRLKYMATAALFTDEPGIRERLYDAGESMLGFTIDQIEGVLWVLVSSPTLGLLGAFMAEDLYERYEESD